jgi:predicted DNA-binding transcriptional regulator YafY
MLQSRGRITAAEVAGELEISERTARRDLEALGMAGLPVYSTPGRNGGWQLLGEGRTDLSGLTAAEARALFLVAGPSAATPELKAALRKLVRALPESFRTHAETAATSVVIDPSGWEGSGRAPRRPPLLDAVQRAVVEGLEVHLGYVARDRRTTTRVVQPLGLAAKASVWYLVAETAAGRRTFRVDRITSVEPTGESVVRPDNFDMAETWREISEDIDQRRTPLKARALAAPHVVPWCRAELGTRVRVLGPQRDGRVELELRGHSPRSLAADVAGFGSMLEILEPAEVRAELATLGTELAATYRS